MERWSEVKFVSNLSPSFGPKLLGDAKGFCSSTFQSDSDDIRVRNVGSMKSHVSGMSRVCETWEGALDFETSYLDLSHDNQKTIQTAY